MLPLPSVSAPFKSSINVPLSSLWPRPVCSSSIVIVPFPSLSRALNVSLRFLISSGLAWQAMQVRAAYCNLQLCINFLKEVRFLFFRNFGCFYAFYLWSLNHLCWRASWAVSLLSGLQISFPIRSLASAETSSHSSPSKSYLPFWTARRISWSSSP